MWMVAKNGDSEEYSGEGRRITVEVYNQMTPL